MDPIPVCSCPREQAVTVAHGREVATLLRGATHAVAFTGAGISMEQGFQTQGESRGFSKLKKEKKKQKQRKKKNAQALYFKSDLPPCARL